MTTSQLWAIRFKSFGFSLLGVLITGIVGYLSSVEFQNLITLNFGETFISTMAFLVVAEVVKHLRNLNIARNDLGSVDELGSTRKMYF